LPDGSAIYGILLHTTGVAVADFGAGCAPDENPEDKMVGPAVLKDIHIHDLKVNVDQVTRTVIDDGPQVMGPAGDVLQLPRPWNKEDFTYVGNSLSDAQVALAKLKNEVSSWSAVQPITWADAKYYFGAVNVPASVQNWAAGTMTKTEVADWKDSLVENSFKCDGDAMTHINKGVVGLRLEFQEKVEISNVKVQTLINVGKEVAAPLCQAHGYKGNDVRGACFIHVKDLEKYGFEVVEDSLHAPNGAVLQEDSMLQLGSTDRSIKHHSGKHLRQIATTTA